MTTTTQRPVTQADIDHSREALERANFKLGKARSRSIMSTAQAAADAQDLQACVDDAAKAENEFATLAERFVTPPVQAAHTPEPVEVAKRYPANGAILSGELAASIDNVLRDPAPNDEIAPMGQR